MLMWCVINIGCFVLFQNAFSFYSGKWNHLPIDNPSHKIQAGSSFITTWETAYNPVQTTILCESDHSNYFGNSLMTEPIRFSKCLVCECCILAYSWLLPCYLGRAYLKMKPMKGRNWILEVERQHPNHIAYASEFSRALSHSYGSQYSLLCLS